MGKQGAYRLRFTDMIIAVLFLFISSAPAFTGISADAGKKKIIITTPSGKTSYNLENNADITVNGVVFRVDKGTVRAVFSTCPEQICVHTGKISGCNSSIICAHNRVVAEITSGNEIQGLNAVSY